MVAKDHSAIPASIQMLEFSLGGNPLNVGYLLNLMHVIELQGKYQDALDCCMSFLKIHGALVRLACAALRSFSSHASCAARHVAPQVSTPAAVKSRGGGTSLLEPPWDTRGALRAWRAHRALARPQELPEEAFISVAELQRQYGDGNDDGVLPLIGISFCWDTAAHLHEFGTLEAHAARIAWHHDVKGGWHASPSVAPTALVADTVPAHAGRGVGQQHCLTRGNHLGNVIGLRRASKAFIHSFPTPIA